MKVCSTCGIEKLESEFSPNKKHKDKLQYSCKTCTNKKQSIRRAGMKKDGKCQHCGKIKENQQAFYCEKCRKIHKIHSREEYHRNIDKRRKQNNIYYNTNKEKISQRQKDFYSKRENKDKINKWRKIHNQKNPSNKLIRNLRRRTWGILNGKKKTITTKDGIGCSSEMLTQHIENQFLPGMTWENYGNKEGCWSIDHIFPFHLCDQNDPDAIIRNNHWTNLRPMWHKDNISRTYEEFKDKD